MDTDENFTPEEIEELRRRIERIDRGEAKTYPAEEVFKKLGLSVSFVDTKILWDRPRIFWHKFLTPPRF